MKSVKISDTVSLSNHLPITIIAGPCQLESRDHAMMMAEKLMTICDEVGLKLIYKTSFDKANRTSVSGKRGAGIEKAIPIFEEIKRTFGCPILTDVHNEQQPDLIKDYADVLQIPAFLCRQTDLLEAAAKTGKPINIKKGQFLAPGDMTNIVQKMEYFGNSQISLTDRGSSFGYNNLVVDMRSFAIMSETGYPVVIDATHSTQSPGGLGNSSGGNRNHAPILARAAVACTKIAGVFMEVHENPDSAPSDGPCMIELSKFKKILVELKAIDDVVKGM